MLWRQPKCSLCMIVGMGQKPKYIELTAGQDAHLRRLEQDPEACAKARLRAQILRLSAKGWSIDRIAEHVGRHRENVRRDLARWEREGVDGLADVPSPGRKPLITPEIEAFLRERLAEERVWDCVRLSEAVHESFGVRVGREAMRLRLRAMGYRWKRTRYVPARRPDAEAARQARAELEGLKRGPQGAGSS